MKNNIRDMVYIGMFAVVMTICAWITIPTAIIPFTMGTFGVFFTLGVLGGRRGTITVSIYILLGSIGIPVFSGFRGGLGALLGNTGGYIVGYFFLALLVWGLEPWAGNRKGRQLFSMVLGLVVCYGFGTVWFMAAYARSVGAIGLWAVLMMCVIPYIIPDLIKIGLAMTLSRQLHRMVPELQRNER